MGNIETATTRWHRFAEQGSTPATPAAGYGIIYTKTDSKWYSKNDAGTETELGGGGGLGNAQDAPTELTIASGAITVTQGFHKIDTEADAGTDDLDTINGLVANALYLFKPENTARIVKFKHGTGNIISPTSSNVVMTDAGIFGWSDGTNFYPQTPSKPNDVDTWGSYPDDSINFLVTDNSSGEAFSITGDEIQLWRTYQLTGAQNITTVPNLHLLLDSATAFLTTVTGTPLAGSAWVIQVLTAPGAGSHTVKLPSGCTYDGTNNTASFNATSDFLEGKWISATRLLLSPATVSVSFSIT